jgi:hypothetical protein
MWHFHRMQKRTKLLSSCKDAANGQSAASIRILLELAPECNSGFMALIPGDILKQKSGGA